METQELEQNWPPTQTMKVLVALMDWLDKQVDVDLLILDADTP